MPAIKSVVVIYNPNSTGSAKDDALSFCRTVRTAGLAAKAAPTKRAGHAKTLAKQYAERATPTMVISASGDGGYNEVINGVLSSDKPRTVTGVLPSGNANDHYHALHHGDTVKRIIKNDTDDIDVLRMSWGRTVRYAHSYIGLGMTPQIGAALTEERPNRLQEILLVIRHIGKIRPVKIRVNGRIHRYDHLVFSNIQRMSKVLKVDRGNMSDGKFEVIGSRQGSLTTLLKHLFQAASKGVAPVEQSSEYTFTVLSRPITVQLDGEVVTIQKGTQVTVTCLQQSLKTIV